MITVYSEDHRLRAAKTELHGGLLVTPFECPERVDHILGRIRDVGLGEVIGPDSHGLGPVLEVHEPDFVGFLSTCWEEWRAAGYEGEAMATCWPSRRMTRMKPPRDIDGRIGYYCLASETAISGGTWEAAQASANVALTATALVAGGERAAFALCRPPGHHAAQDMFGGYCFLNNAAIAAQALRSGGRKRVAVLDVDFHHGNGTQAIFYDRDDVLFLSLHGDPEEAFPHFLGAADEIGMGVGEGFNQNYPLGRGTTYAVWLRAFEKALNRIQDFGAEAVIVSLGVDTYKDDPISFFRLESEDFTDMGRRLSQLGLPTVFVMEGGYAVAEIGVNTVNVLTGFNQA